MRNGRRPGKPLNSNDADIVNLMNQINSLEEGQFVKLTFESENTYSNNKASSDYSSEYYYYEEDTNENDNDNETIPNKPQKEPPKVIIQNKVENNTKQTDPKQINLDDFQIKEKISNNNFSKEYIIIEKKTSKTFLSKVFKNKKNFSQELNIYQRLNSPLISKFIGFNQNDFKNRSNPTIITEFLKNGSLHSILKLKRNGFQVPEWTDTKKLICIYGIASFMSYLHSQNIIHRNLNPKNVFFDDFLFPKIQNFTFSIQTVNNPSKSENIESVGALAYMAPEVITDKKYSKAGDVYSFSIILYEILTNEKPFFGFNEFQLAKKILSGYRPSFNENVSDPFKALIESCWSEKPQKRPSFDEIVKNLKTNSKFITNSVNKEEFMDFIDFADDKSNQGKIKNSKQTIPKLCRKISIDFKCIEKVDESEEKGFLNLSLFEKQSLIAKGEFSRIYQVKNRETGDVYSAKALTIEIEKLKENEQKFIQKEIKIISKLNHNLILKVVGFSPSGFDRKRRPVIVTEIPSNISLQQLFESERKGTHNSEWNDTKKLIVIFGIALSMSILHSHEILHRNLNPTSIFLDNFLNPKIGNFGLQIQSNFFNELIYENKSGLNSSYRYLSPEFLIENKFSKEGDVYSFALIVYEIMTAKIPFKNIKNLNELFDEIVNNSNRPKFTDQIPECYQKLIESCWSQNPQNRPSFIEIVDLMKNDANFITENVNKDDFIKYVKKNEIGGKKREQVKKAETRNSNKKEMSKNENAKRFEQIQSNQKNVDDIDDLEMKPVSKCCYLI